MAIAILREAALLALGFAFVLICLNAMRVGLLTRFMGILGIIVGVLFVIPIGAPVPVVEAFWLVALGYLIGGRWPRGVPPAWITGEAVPWPSQQELREARERESPAPAAPAPAAAGPAGARARGRHARGPGAPGVEEAQAQAAALARAGLAARRSPASPAAARSAASMSASENSGSSSLPARNAS